MLYDEKKYQDAIKVWLMEIDVAPRRVKPYNNIGIAYRKLKDLDAALKYHMNAIQVDPNFGHSGEPLSSTLPIPMPIISSVRSMRKWPNMNTKKKLKRILIMSMLKRRFVN